MCAFVHELILDSTSITILNQGYRIIQNRILADIVGCHTHNVWNTVMLVAGKPTESETKRYCIGNVQVNF